MSYMSHCLEGERWVCRGWDDVCPAIEVSPGHPEKPMEKRHSYTLTLDD